MGPVAAGAEPDGVEASGAPCIIQAGVVASRPLPRPAIASSAAATTDFAGGSSGSLRCRQRQLDRVSKV